MKTFLRTLIYVLPLTINLSLATLAQAVVDSTHSTTTVNSSTSHDNDDYDNWGLLGLVGVIGLAGLIGRGPAERKVEDRDGQVR